MTDLTKQLEQALSHDIDREPWTALTPLGAALLKCVEALEFYGDKNNWNRDLNGWRHDIIEKDLDDETLNEYGGRFSGKRSREAIADIRKALEECK